MASEESITMVNESLWKKIFIDKSVFRIPEDIRFVKEDYLENNIIHIQVYKSGSVQLRFIIISFDNASFELVKSYVSSQVNVQDAVIGGHVGYASEGEYDFIQDFTYPDYNAHNTVNITIHTSEDSFYGLNYYEFIEKMIDKDCFNE